MSHAIKNEAPSSLTSSLSERYEEVRLVTENICARLHPEDTVIQSMEDVSPPKWHLGHTTWFFETFLLIPFLKGYTPYDKNFNFIFNSYYKQAGEHIFRGDRGLLSRPLLSEVYSYRKQVDSAIQSLLGTETKNPHEIHKRIEIGIHHEQQHQELILIDIKHIFFSNPTRPIYLPQTPPSPSGKTQQVTREFVSFEGGLSLIGAEEDIFAYDNELPQHKYYIAPFRLSANVVTNQEYLEFIQDGGYQKADHWLSDGWDILKKEKWQAPLYWVKQDGVWYEYRLNGFSHLDLSEPVCHISFFEADAFARWANKRLPTEFEWEFAAKSFSSLKNGEKGGENNFFENDILHPVSEARSEPCRNLWGNVWEWSSSAYLPYPGFKPLTGALGEYNGKFMNGQRVLRGGSCVTPGSHIRLTYRNFFPPDKRWHFSGIRLADAHSL